MANNLWKLSAKSVRDLLQKSEISPIEAINSAIERISQVNKILNAVPVLCIDRAKESAKKLKDKRINNSKDFLFGLPILIKDLTEVEGVKTTYGSPIYKNNISKYSNYLVENLGPSSYSGGQGELIEPTNWSTYVYQIYDSSLEENVNDEYRNAASNLATNDGVVFIMGQKECLLILQ